MLAGFANQPIPASVPTSPLKRKYDGLCRYCNGVHWGKFCTSEAAISSRQSKPPSRPCSFCTGNHWDIDCKDLAAKKPRPAGLQPSRSKPLTGSNTEPRGGSVKAALLSPGSFTEETADEQDQYLRDQDHRFDHLMSIEHEMDESDSSIVRYAY